MRLTQGPDSVPDCRHYLGRNTSRQECNGHEKRRTGHTADQTRQYAVAKQVQQPARAQSREKRGREREKASPGHSDLVSTPANYKPVGPRQAVFGDAQGQCSAKPTEARRQHPCQHYGDDQRRAVDDEQGEVLTQRQQQEGADGHQERANDSDREDLQHEG